MRPPRLMAVLAPPDDESLGVGGSLAKYASEGVEVFLVTATRGDSGRYRGLHSDNPEHPASGTPYTPSAGQPAMPVVPYKPYAEKPSHEALYEPYKGI